MGKLVKRVKGSLRYRQLTDYRRQLKYLFNINDSERFDKYFSQMIDFMSTFRFHVLSSQFWCYVLHVAFTSEEREFYVVIKATLVKSIMWGNMQISVHCRQVKLLRNAHYAPPHSD